MTVADRIVVISSKTRYRHIPGRISAVSEAEVTIVGRGENAEPQTFNLTSETRVVRHGRTTALTEGMTVVVVAVRDSDTGELSPDAREIFVIPGRRTRLAEEPTDQQPSEDEASSDATITGVFERIDEDGDWIVGGTKVSIRSSTRHERGFNIGQVIRIDAELAASGKLVAREVLSRARSEVVESKTRLVGVYEGKDQQGRWIVSGSRVAVTVRSDTDGEPRVGQRINVTARRLDDGSLEAREVENEVGVRPDRDTRTVDIVGNLRSIDEDGKWRVNGVAIAVDENTKLDGEPGVGSPVRVRAFRSTDGLVAQAIVEVEQNVERATRKVDFRGKIDRIEDGKVFLRGHSVGIETSELTEVDGELEPGKTVHIRAIIDARGKVAARDVEVSDESTSAGRQEAKRVNIEGVVEAVNADGTLTVNGIRIRREQLAATRGDVSEGASVRIAGELRRDGLVHATDVKGEDRAATQAGNDVTVEGVIESIEHGADQTAVRLVINGTTVALRDLTDVKVRLRRDTRVRVHAVIVDGEIIARKVELSRAVHLVKPAAVHISGKIERVQRSPAGGVAAIAVNGVAVHITETTEVRGELEVGVAVRITGATRDRAIVAAVIATARTGDRLPTIDRPVEPPTATPREIEFAGVVEAIRRADNIPLGGIKVRGHWIVVTGNTRVSGVVRVGVEVKVTAKVEGQAIIATEIKGRAAERLQSTVETRTTERSTDKLTDDSTTTVEVQADRRAGITTDADSAAGDQNTPIASSGSDTGSNSLETDGETDTDNATTANSSTSLRGN